MEHYCDRCEMETMWDYSLDDNGYGDDDDDRLYCCVICGYSDEPLIAHMK